MIPPVAHFIWLGPAWPWTHLLAVRSAARRGGFERIVVHRSDDSDGSPWWDETLREPGVEARRLEPGAVFGATGERALQLADLYSRLSEPAGRANVLRAAILWAEGGTYLDVDTVTVRSLTPLRERAGVFCGAERLVFPGHVRRSLDPRVRAKALALTALRDAFRRMPDGWKWFRLIEGSYPTAANNAVFAAEPEHAFVGDLLDRMLAVPAKRQTVRFALGTHLLQTAVREYARRDLEVHEPEVFYPLGPEISEHWFRMRDELPPLDEVLLEDTRVVHWYASVRTKRPAAQLEPGWVRANAGRQLISALAREYA